MYITIVKLKIKKRWASGYRYLLYIVEMESSPSRSL